MVPVVHPDAYVHPTAVLIGAVEIGPRCYIAPGASLRGDFGRIEIAEGANVQDNCTIHCFSGGETRVGPYTNIGHGAVLHGCSIAGHALVGMNAVVMDGATIGENCIVAALAMVPATFDLPDRMLAAGVPAKVLRELTDEEIAWCASGNNDYLKLVDRCKSDFEEVDALTAPDPEAPKLKNEGSKPLYLTREENARRK